MATAMRPVTSTLAALLTAVTLATTASAQVIVSAEGGAGFAHSLGTFRQSYGTGLSVVGGVVITTENNMFSLRLDGRWQRAKADTATSPGGGTFNAFGGTADVVFEPHAGDFAPVSPYFFVGGAAYRTKTSASASAGEPPTTTVTDTRYGVDTGTGLLLAFSDDVHLFAEGRFQYLFAGKPIATGYAGTMPTVSLMVGLRVKL